MSSFFSVPSPKRLRGNFHDGQIENPPSPAKKLGVLDALFEGSGPPFLGSRCVLSGFWTPEKWVLDAIFSIFADKFAVRTTIETPGEKYTFGFPPKTFRFVNFSLFFGCAKLELNTIADASRGTTII